MPVYSCPITVNIRQYRSYLPTSKAMAFLIFKILIQMRLLSTDKAI